MNYSTNKVQVSYFVKLPQSNFHDAKNSPTFLPRLSLFLDISRFPENPEKWLPCRNHCMHFCDFIFIFDILFTILERLVFFHIEAKSGINTQYTDT